MKSWFKGWFSQPNTQTPEEVEHLLWNRSTAEISARLLRRAELHAKCSDAYLRRCAALDRVAAENLRRLELKTGTHMGEWLDRRDLCLRLLREGKN
jgi:hypothetical protein